MIKLRNFLEYSKELDIDVFELGEKVVHPVHGIGEVMGVCFTYFCGYNDSIPHVEITVAFPGYRFKGWMRELTLAPVSS